MSHVTTFTFQALPGKRSAVVEHFDRSDREQKAKATGFKHTRVTEAH